MQIHTNAVPCGSLDRCFIIALGSLLCTNIFTPFGISLTLSSISSAAIRVVGYPGYGTCEERDASDPMTVTFTEIGTSGEFSAFSMAPKGINLVSLKLSVTSSQPTAVYLTAPGCDSWNDPSGCAVKVADTVGDAGRCQFPQTGKAYDKIWAIPIN